MHRTALGVWEGQVANQPPLSRFVFSRDDLDVTRVYARVRPFVGVVHSVMSELVGNIA